MAGSPQPAEDPRQPEVPVCYRHTDRETYVRCTRCDRPICPDCMTSAAVGFHCGECVAEGNRTVRQPRTTFGGRPVRAPLVTWTLLGVIVACFLAQQVVPELTLRFGMLGAGMMPWGEPGGVLTGEWYRLLTSAVLHAGWWHLLFNGVALYIVGTQLERVLGHARYATLWILSALGGSVLSLAVVPGELSVGASGAIFGLFAAIFVIGRRLGVDTRFIVVLIAVNLVLTFTLQNIAWTAHIGGLVSGALLAAAYAYLPRGGRRGRTGLHAALSLGYALILAATTLAIVLL